MTVFLAILGALSLGLLTNDLHEALPWLATKLLRLAARLEASTLEEEVLLFEELKAIQDEVPTKLTKLFFAISRITFALRHIEWRPRRRKARAWKGKQLRPYVWTLVTMFGSILGMMFGSFAMTINGNALLAAPFSAAALLLAIFGVRALRRRVHEEASRDQKRNSMPD